ncbi:hypothetical protein ACP70R_008483 [Stipagrostis hirtigluma subsp. patula]
MEIGMGASAGLAGKLVDLLREKIKRRKGFTVKDVKFLKMEVRSMRAAVSRADREELDPQTKEWARVIRELRYDAEDILDTLLVRMKLEEPNADPDNSDGRELLQKIANSPCDDIKDLISISVKSINERYDRYRISEAPAMSAAVTVDPRLAALYTDAAQLVGIEEEGDELIRRLTEVDCVSNRELKIISVVGVAGLGKTTLANQVYQRLRMQFDCAAFVSVSCNPDMKTVFQSMLSQLWSQKYQDMKEASWDHTKFIGEIENFLQNKRYLIVVDDIWDEKSWLTIKRALVENNCGSRVITTTRKLDVAEKVGGAYKVKPLSCKSSKSLFFYRRIFGNEGKCYHGELAEIGDKFLQKCEGIPLAITTASSWLASLKTGDVHSWYDAYTQFCGHGLVDGFEFRNMKHALSLSYDNLPCHLKTCLNYLSIFPEDYVIRRDRLVWMWIAEGFIQKKPVYNLFDVGQSYFDELLNCSMIQEVEVNDKNDGLVKYCRVPFIILNFICYMSEKENFMTDSQGKVRRLSLQNSTVRFPKDSCLSRVRSVTIFGPETDLMPLLPRFGVLRVLYLEGFDLHSNNKLKYLGKLVHLRYLGLRGTSIYDLPKEIENLQFLLVLDLKGTRIKSLPSCVARLRRLLCLYVEFTTRLPQGTGNLTSLEELSKVSISESPSFAKDVASLMELRVLDIALQQEVNEDLQKQFLLSMCNLSKVQTLRILGHGGSKMEHFLRGGWVPPPALQRFMAMDCLFSAVPTWISSVNLSELQIGLREMWREDLQTLGRLPDLRSLRLAVEHMGERLVVSADAFPCLRQLRLLSETCLVFRQGAMPKLETLDFVLDLDKAKGEFDWGLESLTLLEQVTARLRCANHASRADQAEAALRHAAGVHPNRPTIEIIVLPSDGDEEQQTQPEVGRERISSSAGSSEIQEYSA